MQVISSFAESKEDGTKTRTVLDQFQDCCKDWSLNPGFCFYACKKNVMFTMSFKVQTTKN